VVAAGFRVRPGRYGAGVAAIAGMGSIAGIAGIAGMAGIAGIAGLSGIAGLGRVAVWVAVVAGGLGAVAPFVGRRRWSVPLVAVAAGGCLVAVVVLARALVVGDFSLTYVADFSRRGASGPYRLAGLWGGMAGSLLWLAALAGLAGLLAAVRVGYGRRRADVAAVSGATVAVLLVLVVAFADPFVTLDVPAIDGAGLTPILEHPAMLYHPPLLYLGLATLVGPFAVTVAALVDRQLDDAWVDTVRRWSLVPWTLLALGMVAGSHWAYVELGWGGYWAWDPVENTALLPWLAVTVLLHAARGTRTERPPVARVALAGLACLPFVLALLGSLLTRSGATSSVHAFAEARAIGRALAVVVVLVVAAVVALLARGRARDRGSGESGPGMEASGSARLGQLLAAHVGVVGAALAIVLAGTLWPLLADLRGGDGIAVEGRYFAQFVGPLATVALALVCLVPLALGPRGRRVYRGHALIGGAGALGAVLLVAACAPRLDAPRALLAAAAGAALATGAVATARAARSGSVIGGHLAHAAVGLLVLGIAGTAAGGGRTVSLRPGETADVLGHEIVHDGVAVEDGPVAGSSAAVATVTADGQTLRPSLVEYPDRGVLLAETSLRSTPAGDVQVSLVTADDDGAAVFEVGVHPLQVIVWWGGLALVAAGVCRTWEARSRRGPPAPSTDVGRTPVAAVGRP
jgi:cytochrome c-type biogenesis protein CcmF